MNRTNRRNQKKYYKHIEYIGTNDDVINGEKYERDFILVKLNEPYIAKNNEIIEKVAFYRSTGTSDGYNRRKDMWFPCNGFVYDVQMVPRRGFIVAKMIDKILTTTKIKSDMQGSMKASNLPSPILERFGNEKNFKISQELGGGLWGEEKYKSPRIKKCKKSYEINNLIGKNNRYGIKMNSVLKLTKLKIQIVNSSYLKEGTNLYKKIQAFDPRIFSLNKYHMQKFEIKGIRNLETKKEIVLKEKIPHKADIIYLPPQDERKEYLKKLNFFWNQLILEERSWKAMQRFNQNIKRLRQKRNSTQRMET